MRLIWLLLLVLVAAGAVSGVRSCGRADHLPAGAESAAGPLGRAAATSRSDATGSPVDGDRPRSGSAAAGAAEAPSDREAAPSTAERTPPSANLATAAPAAGAEPDPIGPARALGSGPDGAGEDSPWPIGAQPTSGQQSVENLPGGGLILDGRFILRGRGTPEDPLQVPWDLLRSAQESFDPAQDRHTLPSRVTVLSGRTVRLTGYFATASSEEQTRDLLVMLNKWDGCCLGLPPTPYDAVEVKLAAPVSLRGRHMIRYGTVTGRLSCDPFLVAGWLVGLYRMEDATLEWGG